MAEIQNSCHKPYGHRIPGPVTESMTILFANHQIRHGLNVTWVVSLVSTDGQLIFLRVCVGIIIGWHTYFITPKGDIIRILGGDSRQVISCAFKITEHILRVNIYFKCIISV